MTQKCKLREIEYNAARHLYQPRGYDVDYAMADKVFAPDYRGEFPAEFNQAYVVTTEDSLPDIVRLRDVAPHNVLTVAASGDQAMYYAAAGAQTIDTFDMSFCAKAIQDIKTVAVQKMGWMKFGNFLQSLFVLENLNQDEIAREIIAEMPSDTAEFVQRMTCSQMFGKYRSPYETWRTTHADYLKMQAAIKEPFNFIWTDIADLHTYLYKTYDVINISNICDWMSKKTVPDILKNLFAYLNPGGYIVATSFGHVDWIRPYFKQAEKELKGQARFAETFFSEYVLSLHKVRY